MDVLFAFLCDFAEDDASGKLHALGIGIDQVTTAAVPAVHPLLTVVASLQYSVSEAGTKPLAVLVVDADGRSIAPPIEGELTLGEPTAVLHGRARLVFNLGGMRFERYGDHEVRVTVDGAVIASLPLRVVPPPAA